MDTLVEIFEAKLDKTSSPNGCWLWKGTISNNKYGRFMSKRKLYFIHRLSYELHKGEIPGGLYVCHSCDNPSCVNPEHLFLGTPKDNTEDMMRKNRGYFYKGHKKGFAIKETQNKPCLHIEEILCIKRLSLKGISQRNLGKMFGVTQTTIWRSLQDKYYGEI